VIRVVALDIDGVVTTGDVILDEAGRESKSLFFRDIDAVFAARREGLQIVLVTGEETPIVGAIASKLGIERVWAGRKDKHVVLVEMAAELGVELEEVCYVGDSLRDAPALELAGLGLAPADAAPEASAAADQVLEAPGGRGAVDEALAIVLGARRSG
jgi:YrbI family 3-deoxy-D-manno-octulosonate 8-phosphate phosphatase